MTRKFKYKCEATYRREGIVNVKEEGDINSELKNVFKHSSDGVNFLDILNLETEEIKVEELYNKVSSEYGFPIVEGQTIYLYPKKEYYCFPATVLDVNDDLKTKIGTCIFVKDSEMEYGHWVGLADYEVFQTESEAHTRVVQELAKKIPQRTGMSIKFLIEKLEAEINNA